MNATWIKPKDNELLSQKIQNGDQLLVAYQCQSRYNKDKYYWEYAVVKVHCDVHYFRLTVNDEPWYDWEDIEYYIPLSEFSLAEILLPANLKARDP